MSPLFEPHEFALTHTQSSTKTRSYKKIEKKQGEMHKFKKS